MMIRTCIRTLPSTSPSRGQSTLSVSVDYCELIELPKGEFDSARHRLQKALSGVPSLQPLPVCHDRGHFLTTALEHVVEGFLRRLDLLVHFDRAWHFGTKAFYRGGISYKLVAGLEALWGLAVHFINEGIKGRESSFEESVHQIRQTMASVAGLPSVPNVPNVQGRSLPSVAFVDAGIAYDRDVMNAVLRHAGLPVPRVNAVNSAVEALTSFELFGRSVLLRPVLPGPDAGACIGVVHRQQVVAAFGLATEHADVVLVEEVFLGNDYHVQILEGCFAAAIQDGRGDVTAQAHVDIRQICTLAAGVMGLSACSLHLTLPDISKPLICQHGGIVEFNLAGASSSPQVAARFSPVDAL